MLVKQKVSVIGLGYVGLPLALLIDKKGYHVSGIDLDKPKLEKIKRRIDPLGDHYISKMIKASKLVASDNFKDINSSDIVVICVPTPVKNGSQPDLSPLKNAAKSVAENINKGSLIIIESTINPGVCDDILTPLIEEISGLKVNGDFYLAHCPERINPGDSKWTVENIPRVIGGSNNTGVEKAVSFYESILDAPMKKMASLKEAESVKIVENSFRDINIAFVNELAKSFTKLGINVKNVIDGAATKPFAFMAHYPGVGVGGHCIPVDPYYLIEYAKGYGFEHEFLSLARAINNSMPEFTVDRLIQALNEAGIKLKAAKVALLGLSYKPNVADDRESPSYKLIKILKDKGVKLTIYDPYFLESSTVKTLDEAIKNQDAIVVATDHREFKKLLPKKLTSKVFIDGKNAFDRNQFDNSGIIYRGIGV